MLVTTSYDLGRICYDYS